MAHEHYAIVEHDGGWAYTAMGVFSETFRTHDEAFAAARRAAAEQGVPDTMRLIEYQDDAGVWRLEIAAGDDRPEVDVAG
jgi:hypothetical protein